MKKKLSNINNATNINKVLKYQEKELDNIKSINKAKLEETISNTENILKDIGYSVNYNNLSIINKKKTIIVPTWEDRSIGIYQGIEEEIKTRLDQCQSGFTVKGVELLDEEGMVIVTVISRDDPKEIGNREEIYIDPVVLGENEAENESRQISQEEKAQDQGLKKLYSECVGISPEKIVIKYVGG